MLRRNATRVTIASLPTEPAPPTTPPVRVLRQSEDEDIPYIQALQTPFTQIMFGEINLRSCMEKYVCKTLVNTNDEVVAFLVIMDHPNIPTLSHCQWVGWIRRFYRIDFASPWNTRFIHYLVWDNRYTNIFLSCLKSLYKNNDKLEQIVMVTPPGVNIFPELEPFFTLVYPSVGEGGRSALAHFQNLHINLRHRVLSKLTIRRAGEEDNIDVQPLVHHQLNVLKYVYGDIKLGSIIDVKSSSKVVLVSEKGSATVGVISLSSKVDYHHINFFFHHVFETKATGSSAERGVRMETIRSECRRGLPFTADTMLADEQLSMELKVDKSFEDTSVDEDDDRDEMTIVYWDEDGDMFRVVDPVMEYLLHKESHGSVLRLQDDDRKESTKSKISIDHTYFGRPSWSNSFLPITREASLSLRDKVTMSGRDQTVSSIDTPTENAFIITLLALHPDLDARYAFDLLEASFESFPDKHFCLLSLPTAYQGSPLTRYMVRVSPKLLWDFPHELYFIHRNAMFSEFNVRPVTVVDHADIQELVEHFSNGKKICKEITKIILCESPNTKGFVLECEGSTVGVAVVKSNFELNKIQPHFMVDKVINITLYDQEKHGLIRHLVLCPIFLKSGPFFLRQIMHQAELETLSYFLHHEETNSLLQSDANSISVLGDLTPVKPRRWVKYELSALDELKPQEHVLRSENDYALFIATEKLLSVPKLELNYRIVVVGGSITAMSFLENLIFRSARKQIKYNNLVLVSIHGFPLELQSHTAADRMVPQGGFYTREYLSRISLSTHVNVLYGALTVINRMEKMICLNNEHWMRYDYLFLTTGLQFVKPWPVMTPSETNHTSTCQTISYSSDLGSCFTGDQDLPNHDCRKNEDLRELYNNVSKQHGENLFVINTSADAILALGHLKNILKHKTDGKILVFGHGLSTFTCVQSLLIFGVPGHKIVLVIAPHVVTNYSCLETNPFVDKTVAQTLEELGVTIHRGFSLIRWSLKHKLLEKVMFRNIDNVPLTIDCIAFFCYGSRSTNAKTFLAVNDSGIVYNNGIIIDNRFRTNDEYIYAAGSGTRYSNRYSPNQFSHHKYYNPAEIGLVLSKTFRRLVEPRAEVNKELDDVPQILEENVSSCSEKADISPSPETLPRLREPVTWVAQLPGGWNYVKVTAPGRPLPLECQLSGQGDSGPVIITGVPILPDGPGYFQLSFSIFNTVREIVLLSKKEIPYQNLCQLYGKHERLLNNLYELYNQGLISDLYSFFGQPWAYALYTTGFNKLTRQCAEFFVSSDVVSSPPLKDLQPEELHRLIKDRETINSRYSTSSIPLYVDHLVLRYVRERPQQLPMYFTDATLALSRSALAHSPLHRDPTKLRRKTKTSSILN
ncbi:cilia- and flagella-associated protein 61 [Macrosteles quadrilineatus]|uniref:cilia- and flagella-associated protein 61 n=1 Tax=Macrosteles quadrilineatus TaxID=74068 RepID=UPI0023E1442A|nr:cilia- and flagella-associated protein 61 [Macrosteles quadrilineatus]